ncbi:TPA: hypothetical protein N0F65_003858 [Lagenidium giganteum]|uniref:Uncharacterized protein n=1 Tax=Lagenidium giganteum TaxID=4803 RepID=A0AAV2ZD73_9STRA|nr:TPA: hypothetical protein N0F65_003858 [Lagenidium giganteum]
MGEAAEGVIDAQRGDEHPNAPPRSSRNVSASSNRRHSAPRLSSPTTASLSDLIPEITQQRQPRRNSVAEVGYTVVKTLTKPGSFFGVFGWLGIPMLATFVAAAAALFFQAYIQLHPTEMANKLLNTTNYDNGEFWLLDEVDEAISGCAAAVLIIIGVGYIALGLFAVFYRRSALIRHVGSKRVRRNSNAQDGRRRDSKVMSGMSPVGNSAMPMSGKRANTKIAVLQPPPLLSWMLAHLGRTDPLAQLYKNALFDLPKLIFQTVTLVVYLRDGFPMLLINLYMALLVINWIISIYRFSRFTQDHKLIIARVFYLYDLFFAVFAPMVVLFYSCKSFQFDRAGFQAFVNTVNPGLFERIARLIADPVEMSIVRAGFSNLRLETPSQIIVKLLLNLLSLFKWQRIISTLVSANRIAHRRVIALSGNTAITWKQHVLGWVVFASCGAFTVLYTAVAQVSSINNCKAYPQCAVVSYQWYWGWSECLCRVLVDREVDPRTYDEWVSPTNITQVVADLSLAGELYAIQVVNRLVYPLPEELRRCTNLNKLILIYTKTDRLPEWMNEFTQMQYFHFEGDFSMAGLSYAPKNAFSGMNDLRFIHMGGIQGLQAFHVKRLPSLAKLRKLKTFTLIRRNEMCCNGYIDGTCNLNDQQCLPRVGEPVVECLNVTMSAENKAVINKAQSFVCGGSKADLRLRTPTKFTTDTLCGGVKYKQCQMGNVTMNAPVGFKLREELAPNVTRTSKRGSGVIDL